MSSPERQLELPFTRGEQLTLRREIKLPPDEKFVLWILDDHIGKGAYWPMTVQLIADESGFSVSKVYKVLASLKERTLVHWDRKPDTRGEKPRPLGPGERRFFICWSNFEELPTIRKHASPEGQKSPMENSTEGADSPLEKPDSPMEKKTAPKFSNGELHIRKNDHSNDLSTPSGTATTDVSDSILRKLKAAGVERARTAWQKAIANGLSPEAFEAVLDHALAHSGKWPGAVIFSRLTTPDAIEQEPSEGWFGENSNWRPAAAQAVPDVDAIPDSDVRRLLPWELQERFNAIVRARGHPRHDPEIRAALEAALMDRSVQERNDREAVGV